MMTDPIADMLTRIRNTSMIKKREVCVPYSKIKLGIAKVLVDNGYLESVEEKKSVHPYIFLVLKYDNNQPAMQYIKRISKPGRRVYVKASEIKKVLNGLGISVLSTPKGLMTGLQAKQQKIGGEIICEVY
ncbi:MAG: 30S ribosomal protein S8 [bacterium]